MEAPINVKIEQPDVPDWDEEARDWVALNREVQGNPGFYPLTIKFGYVVGVLYGICESVACLLRDKHFARRVSYIPAYGLFASGVEILGRCITGESCHRKATLKQGLQWLACPRYPEYSEVSATTVLIRTSVGPYPVKELQDLRHFAAHGQATSAFHQTDRGVPSDYETLPALLPPLIAGLERYWVSLNEDDDLCQSLAKANIRPLRAWHVYTTWVRLQGAPGLGPNSLTDLFNEFAASFRVQ